MGWGSVIEWSNPVFHNNFGFTMTRHGDLSSFLFLFVKNINYIGYQEDIMATLMLINQSPYFLASRLQPVAYVKKSA